MTEVLLHPERAGSGTPRRRHRARPRTRSATVVTVVVALASVLSLASGSVLLVHGLEDETARPPQSAAFRVDPADLPALEPVARGVPQTGSGGCRLGVDGSSVVIPSLCVDAPVVPTDLGPAGSLVIPADVRQVGHWSDGASLAASESDGTTLLAGHVSHTGQGEGALFPLGRVRPGDVVYTVDRSGVVSPWRTVSLRVVRKSSLPTDVFAGSSGPRRLVVVTCGGPIHQVAGQGRTYRDNVIVTAVPLSGAHLGAS